MYIDDLDFRLDEIVSKNEVYLHGQCHLFAIALHRLTGLHLAGVLDFDAECTATHLVHSYVEVDNEHILDIYGVRSYARMMEDFMCWDPEPCLFKEENLLELGEGKSYLDEEACKIIESALVVAAEVLSIEKQLESLQAPHMPLTIILSEYACETIPSVQMSLF